MEQTEPVNPRVMCSERTAGCVYDSSIAAEISGYIDIGMKDEALRLTRKVLEKRRILPDEFSAAVRTIGVYESSFKRWRTKLEAAYNRQSRRFKRKVRTDMLGIYASLNDREIAVQFIDVRRPTYPDVLFGMDALLKLNKLEEAQLLASQCAKALRSTTDRFEQSVLLTGLGEYYSRIQRWDDALAAWEHMPLEQPFRRDALSGIVKIHLARALHAATRGLQLLSELKKNPDKEIQLIAPGNDLALMLDAEKELLKFKRGIEKILREKVRKDLGIPIQSDHQNAKSTPTA